LRWHVALARRAGTSRWPEGTMVNANFMRRIGLLKVTPTSGMDVFVNAFYPLQGN
jgi:hypothetical protein